MKLTVTYSADGEVVPDLKVGEWLERLITILSVNMDQAHDINIGTHVMMDAIRVAIYEKRLSYKDVVAKFEGEELIFDKDAGLNHWPVGYCDTQTKYLERLFGVN